MKILFVGEIVGHLGRDAVKECLPQIISEIKPDLVLSNIENLSGGRGIREENVKEMMRSGINFFTSGDHIFWQKGTEDFIDNLPLVVPANYPSEVPGKSYSIVDTGKTGRVLVFNLIGRTSYSSLFSYFDDPFRKADQILEETSNEDLTARVIDFHADNTSEKAAFARYLDGRVNIIVGSHTHIPTCDPIVLPKGTMFITDVGMTGSVDSVLGVKTEIIIKQYLTARNQKFEWESTGRTAFRSVLFDTVEMKISRIDRLLS